MVESAALFAVDHTSGPYSFVGLLHTAQLRHDTCTEEKNYGKGKEWIEQIRDSRHISCQAIVESHSLYAVLLDKQAGIEGSPGRERKQYADRSAGSVKHVGERLSWKFSFIIHTLHADTDGQHIQIIIYENQKTKNKCRKQGLSFGVTQLADDFLETIASF